MLNDSIDTTGAIDKIRGHVTVELFDAKSGKLVDKQEQHNFIANSGKEYLRYLQRANFKNQISTLATGADVDKIPINPFEAIALTDSTKTEDSANEWIMLGKLVGYSTKATYAGADTKRGTPSGSLSETTSTYTKWVFDWPVHSANGTIGSVGWMPAIYKNQWEYSNDYNVFCADELNNSSTLISYKASPFAQHARPMAYANSNLMFFANGTTTTSYDANLATINSFSTINASGIAWDSSNSKLWVISGSQIASYSSTGTVIDAPISITTRSYRGLTFDGTNLWTLVGTQAHCINTSGADVSNFATTFGTLGDSLTTIVIFQN